MLKLILLGLILQALAQNLNKSLINPQISQLYNASIDGDAQFIQEVNSDQLPPNVQEYGYGFWFRFLTTYPKRLPQGKNADYYFMARLTVNQNYSDVGMGDRLLALWQGQGYYHFTTCNTVNNDPNVHTNVDNPPDIEGLWTYIYYSHSQDLNTTVGFIQFGDQSTPFRIQLNVTHPDITYLKFILAGKQFNYPGFNGQIYNLVYGISEGAFIDDQANFYEMAGLIPNFDLSQLDQYNIVSSFHNISAGQGVQQYDEIGGGQDSFPKEYSVSGWFKWSGPYVGDWNLVYRLTINDETNNADASKLGDRTLSVFANKNNFYRCSTYSYYNMIGDGIPDYHLDIQHQGQIEEWHFLYFGYSKYDSRAFYFFQNHDMKLSQEFVNTHHYLTNKFYFLLRDNRYPNYNGVIDKLNVNLGTGAFLESQDDYFTINHIFSYLYGLNNLLNQTVSLKN